MVLPIFPQKPKNSDYYLGLFLKEDRGIGFILEGDGKRLSLLAKEKFIYSNGWDNLLEDVDEMIFKLEKQTKKTVDKTIFFVYSHVVDEKTKEIKKPYLNVIKELVKNLELKPLGYIECYEGIVTYLEEEEQIPLTAVLIELDKSNIGVFIYQAGRKVFWKILSRTSNLIGDLLVVFEQTKSTILLPSRLILYNSMDLDEETTKILTYRWRSDLFIQLPKVEVIKEDPVFKGLIKVFQEQIYKNQDKNKISLPEKKEVLGFIIGGEIEKKQFEDQPKMDFAFKTSPADFIFKIKLNIIVSLSRLIRSIKFKSLWLIVLILILFGLLMGEYFFHKADLTVFLPTKPINKQISYDKESLNIYTATVTAEFSQSKQTTGKKDVGERAKGEVVIHSFDDKEKNFPKGTTLETNGIKFVLEKDIKIASASLSLTSNGWVTLPGKGKVSVVAYDTGTEGNLDKGQKFKIGDLNQNIYFAINESAFTGGSKKETKTVSKKDLEDLKTSILDKAKKDNQAKIKDNLKNNQKTIDSLTELVLAEPKFSKELGEEANEVELKSKVITTYYFYDVSKLMELFKSTLNKEAGKEYELMVDNLNYNIKNVSKKNNQLIVDVNVKGKAIKKVVKDQLINKLIGLNKEDLERVLKKDFSALGFELTVKPSWLFIKDRMPLFKKNITIKFSSL